MVGVRVRGRGRRRVRVRSRTSSESESATTSCSAESSCSSHAATAEASVAVGGRPESITVKSAGVHCSTRAACVSDSCWRRAKKRNLGRDRVRVRVS